MNARRFPHVKPRNGVYYYYRRVPQNVKSLPDAYEREFGSKPFVRESLRTKIYTEALKSAAQREEQFDAQVARAVGRSLPASVLIPRVQLTPETLGNIAAEICSRIALEWRVMILRAKTDVDADQYLEQQLGRYIDRREATDKATAILLGRTVVEYARELNASKGFMVAEDSFDFAELVGAVTDGCHAANKAVNEMFDGHSLPLEPTSTLITNFGKPRSEAQKTKRLSEVIAIQLSVKDFAAKTRMKMERSQQVFISLVGDKDINEYTKADVRTFLDHLTQQQVGKTFDGSRPISKTTIQSYLSGISSPFNFALSRGWLEEGNPASGMQVENWRAAPNNLEVPKRRRFEVTELNAIFQHPWFSGCQSKSMSYVPGAVLLNDMRYWAPVVAVYTGMRAGELAGLMLDEVKFEDDAPHILVKCNKYRNTKSKLDRHVPILDALLELGFREYVDMVRRSGSDRLFPDWQPSSKRYLEDPYYNWANAKYIRAFNRTVIPSALPHVVSTGTRSPVVFHSFRGAFKFMLLGHGNPHLANAILGHSQDDLDKAYIGTVSPRETYAAFRSANFIDVKIPARKPSQR